MVIIRPCAIASGAAGVRRQAYELALATFRATSTSLVVVALPQSATRSALLVFERDLVDGESTIRSAQRPNAST